MKKILSLLAILAMLVTVGLGGCAQESGGSAATESKTEAPAASAGTESSASESAAPTGETQLIRTLAGSTGGAWYSQMSALTQCLEEAMGNVRTSVSPGAVISNIRYVENGESDIAMAYTNSDEAAVGGYSSFEEEGAYSNICHILTMNPLYLTIMTRKDSDIETFADLLGKHIVPGEANSIAEEFFRYTLEAYGYTYDDIQKAGGVITYASYGEGTTMVQDRNADVVVLFANHPNNNSLTLDASTGIKLVNIDEPIADQIIDTMPGIVKATVPDVGVYNFTADDQVLAIGSKQTIICNKSLSEDLVYNLCKVFYENLEAISVSEARIKSLTPETMLDGVINIPVHPGAQKFYDEYMAAK